MSDITKCNNEECPLKESCYRFTAPTEKYQSYANFPYDDNCDYYWNANNN